MKFNEGVWNARENIQVTNAVEVSTLISSLDDSTSSIPLNSVNGPTDPYIQVLCASRHIKHRGDLINKTVLTVQVTSPAEGVIGIEATHFYGKGHFKEPEAPKFPSGKPAVIQGAAPKKLNITDTHATLTTEGGRASAVVDLRPNSFAIDIRDKNGKHVTDLGKDTIAWILHAAASPLLASKENASQTVHDPYFRSPEAARQGYMSMALSLEPGELVYGLGERFGPFIKNGQIIESSNDDGGSSSDSAYKCIPFYLTNRNYGVLVDQLDHVSFEVQSDKMTKVQMSVPGERLRIYVFVGSSPKEVLSSYTQFTGRATLPPDWSYGLWLSTSFLTNYDEKSVMTYIDRMQSYDIPLHVFHFDCFWMRPHTWRVPCDFQFDPAHFPDPKGFLDRIHKRGIKVCVWINPWVGQASRLFAEGDAKGYFVKRRDGRTFQSDTWQPGCSTVDFTNPAAKKWWQGYLAELLDLGVDCFKTDFGERITTEGVVWHDGSNPRTMHNAYALLYNEAVWEVLVEKRGLAQAIVFARAATIGTQRFPVHWGGDVDSKFSGLAETIRGGLSLGLSGFGYHSSDIGGFKSEGKAGGDSGAVPPGAVYKRWCQFGLLSSHSRLHGSGSPRVPWGIDEEACSVLSKFTRLKNRMEPYLTSESILGVVARGHPLMRPIFVEFPQDRTAWLVDQQYMLGSSLLVAPIFGQSEVEYYLPDAGAPWTNILTGEAVVGGRWVKEEHDMMSLPVLLRPDSALFLGKDGHTVTDVITKRGFTVLVGRHVEQPILVKVALRSGQNLDLSISPISENGSVVGFKTTCSNGKIPYEVVVIGNGIGLDKLASRIIFEAKGGVCVATLDDE